MSGRNIFDSVLSSYAEIHQVQIAVGVLVICYVLYRNGQRKWAGAVLAVTTIAQMVHYSQVGWGAHPWYYTTTVAVGVGVWGVVNHD